MIKGTKINFPNSCEICIHRPICNQTGTVCAIHEELKERFKDSDRLLYVNLECPFFHLNITTKDTMARKECNIDLR